MELFHQWIKEEKEHLGIQRGTSSSGPTTYITIHRERMLEDGYQQLGLLSALSLKGTIRVKFINPQVCTYKIIIVSHKEAARNGVNFQAGHVVYMYVRTFMHILQKLSFLQCPEEPQLRPYVHKCKYKFQ